MSPFRTGVALAATVAVFYVLCTLAWVAAPEAFLRFLGGLFHGLDFRAMYRPAPFDAVSFALVTGVWIAWSFCAGAFYALVARRLGRLS